MNDTPRLSIHGLTKKFPGVLAVSEADLTLAPGEIHALVGENGSGKSTLCMTLSGVYQRDAGEIQIDGERVSPASPRQAQLLGVSMMYQESNLVPELTVSANIALGRESFVLNRRQTEVRVREILDRLDFHLDPSVKASHLSGAQMQMAEIAKALYEESKIIIMDEPTAALNIPEARALHKVIRDVAATGVSVIYISHALEEALEIADNVTVLRDGKVVACRETRAFTRGDLVELMVGRHIGIVERPTRHAAMGEELLRVENISLGNRVKNASVRLSRGEVVGLAGLVGSGRSELAMVICGVIRPTAGTIYIDGKRATLRSPRAAMRHGIAYLSENRKEDGLFLQLTVLTNLTISILDRLTNWVGLVRGRRETAEGRSLVDRFSIIIPGLGAKVQTLSGGNQQKSLIARLIEADLRILIFDEPTKGVDVGAIESIHKTIRSLASEGKAVLVVSSYLPEIMAISDRVLVMRDGELVANFTADEVTEDKVMAAAFG